MNELRRFFIVTLIAGLLLGAFFFGGLWWTVQKGLTSNNPVLWFYGSTLLRTSFAVAGFYLTAARRLAKIAWSVWSDLSSHVLS